MQIQAWAPLISTLPSFSPVGWKGAAPALSRAYPATWAQDPTVQLAFPHARAKIPSLWTSYTVICVTRLILGVRTYWLLLPVWYPLLSSQPGFLKELSSHPHCPCLSQSAASGVCHPSIPLPHHCSLRNQRSGVVWGPAGLSGSWSYLACIYYPTLWITIPFLKRSFLL